MSIALQNEVRELRRMVEDQGRQLNALFAKLGHVTPPPTPTAVRTDVKASKPKVEVPAFLGGKDK